jgi:hypothetical protein
MIDADRARSEVEKDVAAALGGQLPDGNGFSIDDAFPEWEVNPMADDGSNTVAVPWTWHGMNEGLLGLAATHREVTLRGVTVLTERGPDLMCQRYVDWLPALQQAGIVLFTRPIVESTRPFSADELADPDLKGLVDEIAALRQT